MTGEEALALSKKFTTETALGQGAVQGPPGQNGRETQIQNNGTYIQWRYVGDTSWNNIVALADLKGADGLNGTNGQDGPPGANGQNGADGQPGANGLNGHDGQNGETPQLRVTGNVLQYKFPSQSSWTDLFTFSNSGNGGQVDPADLVSEDQHNALTLGDDGGLFVPESSGGGYSPPQGGIPIGDLSQEVRGLLALAESALQTETDPVFTAAQPNLALKSEIPTDNNQLANSSGFITSAALVVLASTAYVNGQVGAEATARDGAIATAISTEVTDRNTAIAEAVDPINDVIPNQATAANQLADKNFVNSTANNIAAFRVYKTNTRGDFSTAAELQAAISSSTFYRADGSAYTPTMNDYTIITADETAPDPFTNGQTRWKHFGSAIGWGYDFGLNNRPFTSAENAALASGITDTLTAKLSGLRTNSETDTLLAGKLGVNSQAADSAKLDGKLPSEYATAAQGAKADNALPMNGKAADSDRLDNLDSLDFMRSTALNYAPAAASFLGLVTEILPTTNSTRYVNLSGAAANALTDHPSQITANNQCFVRISRTTSFAVVELTYAASVANAPNTVMRFLRRVATVDTAPVWADADWVPFASKADVDDAQFAVNTPDYSSPVNLNLQPVNLLNGWTATQDGFLHLFMPIGVDSAHPSSSGSDVYFTINNNRVASTFILPGATNQMSNNYDLDLFVPIKAGQVVKVGYTNVGWATLDIRTSIFYPPVRIQAPTINETFSTTETNTGKTWRDGKPIFRRCFNVSTGGGGTIGSINLLTSVVERVINSGGVFYYSGNNFIEFGSTHVENSSVSLNSCLIKSGSTLNIYYLSNNSSAATFDIWVEYTKV